MVFNFYLLIKKNVKGKTYAYYSNKSYKFNLYVGQNDNETI